MAPKLARLVARLGPHPAVRAGLDPTLDADAARWLALALLLASRADEERALAAFAAIFGSRAGGGAAGEIEPEALALRLLAARVPQPERVAATLWRAGRAFEARYGSSLARLAAGADDLESLGARITALAPGVGTATALRFLRPLRERFSAAREVPLAASARAAARHLGLLAADEDAEGEPALLRARAAREPDAPPFADVEAALERLGAASCLRERSARCPLGADCPVSGAARFD